MQNLYAGMQSADSLFTLSEKKKKKKIKNYPFLLHFPPASAAEKQTESLLWSITCKSLEANFLKSKKWKNYIWRPASKHSQILVFLRKYRTKIYSFFSLHKSHLREIFLSSVWFLLLEHFFFIFCLSFCF